MVLLEVVVVMELALLVVGAGHQLQEVLQERVQIVETLIQILIHVIQQVVAVVLVH